MVVGVDLDGEVVVGIDDFEEKGEVGAEVVEVFLTEDFAHVYFQSLVDGVFGEEAVGDDRFVARETGESPEFAAVGQGVVVEAEGFDFVAAPYFVFEEGEEFEWIERGFHG